MLAAFIHIAVQMQHLLNSLDLLNGPFKKESLKHKIMLQYIKIDPSVNELVWRVIQFVPFHLQILGKLSSCLVKGLSVSKLDHPDGQHFITSAPNCTEMPYTLRIQ